MSPLTSTELNVLAGPLLVSKPSASGTRLVSDWVRVTWPSAIAGPAATAASLIVFGSTTIT